MKRRILITLVLAIAGVVFFTTELFAQAKRAAGQLVLGPVSGTWTDGKVAEWDTTTMTFVPGTGGAGGGMATTDIDTSAEIRAIVGDESGTGALLFAGGAIGAATATTASAGDDDTSVATTAFVQDEVDATQTGTHASPSTENPLAPTWGGPLHTVWYGATGEIDLPAASTYAGRAILIYNTGAFTITIDPNSSEVIVRDGTVQSGGVTFTLSSGAGNYVSMYCDGARWITLGYKGILTLGS